MGFLYFFRRGGGGGGARVGFRKNEYFKGDVDFCGYCFWGGGGGWRGSLLNYLREQSDLGSNCLQYLLPACITLVNVYVDLVVFTRIAGTLKTGSGIYWR